MPHTSFTAWSAAAFYIRRKASRLYPQLHGGESDSPYRSGTPALAEIRALETALELALAEEAARYDLVAAHNAYLRAALKGESKVTVNSPATAVPHILNLSIAGLRGAAVQAALAQSDICISVKSACSTDCSAEPRRLCREPLPEECARLLFA